MDEICKKQNSHEAEFAEFFFSTFSSCFALRVFSLRAIRRVCLILSPRVCLFMPPFFRRAAFYDLAFFAQFFPFYQNETRNKRAGDYESDNKSDSQSIMLLCVFLLILKLYT